MRHRGGAHWGTRGWRVRPAGMPRLPLGVRRQGHVGTQQGLSPTTAELGGANPGNRERKSRGTLCDVATPTGLGPVAFPPPGQVTLARPAPERSTWAGSAGPGDGAGAGIPIGSSALPPPRLRAPPWPRRSTLVSALARRAAPPGPGAQLGQPGFAGTPGGRLPTATPNPPPARLPSSSGSEAAAAFVY